jgi:amidophosphoribosyltransferase
MPERSTDGIAQAVWDLSIAEQAVSSGFAEWACFIAQQAAEKALKAVYQKRSGAALGAFLSLTFSGSRESLENT